MNTKLAALDGAVNDRLKLSAHGEEVVKAAQAAQTKLNEVLLPAGEKAQADITMVSMTIGGDANQSMMTLLKLVSTQVPVSQGFADLVGFVNLASSLLDRAAVAPERRQRRGAGEEFQGDVGAGSRRSSISSIRCSRPTACARRPRPGSSSARATPSSTPAARRSPPASSARSCWRRPAASPKNSPKRSPLRSRSSPTGPRKPPTARTRPSASAPS